MNLAESHRIQNLDQRFITEKQPARVTVEGVEILVRRGRSQNIFIAHKPGTAFPMAFEKTAAQAVWTLIGKLDSEARQEAF